MKTARTAFRLFCATILVLAVIQVAWVRQARSTETPAAPEAATSGSVMESVAALSSGLAAELENKRLAIETKERDLAEQEQRLKEREKELEKKLKDMERLRAEVSGELDTQRKNSEEKVMKMVSVLESMSPKAASGVLETLDEWLAVEVLKRMDVKRVAKILNLTDKNRTAKLSELLTGYYRVEDARVKRDAADRQISGEVQNPAGQAAPVMPGTGAVASANGISNVENQKQKGGE